MSKARTVKNYEEALKLIKKYSIGSEHMLALALVQMIEREKVRVLNRYRQEHGEPLLPTDPPYILGSQTTQWVIDVPKSWISETGRTTR